MVVRREARDEGDTPKKPANGNKAIFITDT